MNAGNALGGLALAGVGIYVGAVAYHDRIPELLALLGHDKGFLPWLVVLLVLYALYQIDAIRPAVVAIGGLTVLAVVLTHAGTITKAEHEVVALGVGG